MKNLKKALGIFLALTMILTMIPTFALADEAVVDYNAIVNEISFADFKGTNAGGQFNITADLDLRDTFTASDAADYAVTWTSSDESVISNAGVVTTTTSKVDRWVTITAKIENATKSFKLRVKAATAAEDILFAEDFDDMTVGEFTNMDSAAEGMKGWYVNVTNAEHTSADGTTQFDIINNDENADENVMKMTARSSGKNYFLTNNFASSVSGIVAYDADVKFPYKSIQCPFWPYWHVKGTDGISHPFNSGAQSAAYRFKDDEWQHVTTIYDITNKTVDTYIDGVLLFSDTNLASATLNGLTSIATRLQDGTLYAGSIAYIDNIEVKQLTFDAEAEALASFDPTNSSSNYAGTNIVDKDLKNTITIGNDTYDITYASSDESVVSSTGKVKLSDFVRNVTVTPQIMVGDIAVKGSSTCYTVLPITSNYTVHLYEDFESIDVVTEASGTPGNAVTTDTDYGTDVEVGDIFDCNGEPIDTDSGWTLNNKTNYRKSFSNLGSRSQIVSADGDKVLRMYLNADHSDYRLQKSIDNPFTSGRVALSIRIKAVNGKAKLSSQFMGRLYDNKIRGDFGGTGLDGNGDSANDDIAVSMANDGNWHTYLFVYDVNTTKTIGNYVAIPLSIYVDGEFMGTSWKKHTSADGNTKYDYEATDRMYICQWGTNGAAEVYVDDILLMNFDSKDIQLAGTTVADGVVTKADVQCVSYETTMPGEVKLLAAAYNSSDELICAKVVNANVTAVGDNESDLGLDITGAAYYRLFVFDGLTNIKPLALSKIYNIAE